MVEIVAFGVEVEGGIGGGEVEIDEAGGLGRGGQLGESGVDLSGNHLGFGLYFLGEPLTVVTWRQRGRLVVVRDRPFEGLVDGAQAELVAGEGIHDERLGSWQFLLFGGDPEAEGLPAERAGRMIEEVEELMEGNGRIILFGGGAMVVEGRDLGGVLAILDDDPCGLEVGTGKGVEVAVLRVGGKVTRMVCLEPMFDDKRRIEPGGAGEAGGGVGFEEAAQFIDRHGWRGDGVIAGREAAEAEVETAAGGEECFEEEEAIALDGGAIAGALEVLVPHEVEGGASRIAGESAILQTDNGDDLMGDGAHGGEGGEGDAVAEEAA